jgi:hypothetical protein
MKKITVISLMVFALITINLKLMAQKTVVNETNEHLGGTVNPAFSVFIENAEYKTVLKAWKTFFEDHKGKVESSKNDVSIADAEFTLLSSTPVAVFSRVTEDKTGVKIVAAFNKEGQYICTKFLPAETEIVKKNIYDFAVSVKKNMVQAEIDDATKLLENLKSKNKDLVDKKSGLEKDIQTYNKKIKKVEDEMIKNPEMTAEDKAKQEKEIQNLKLKISEAENNIKTNDMEQSEMKAKIENQVKVVTDLQAKFDAVD